MSETLLEISGARVLRGGCPIIDVDAFSVRSGEHLAILGPNGAGKSTLVGLLTREVAALHTEPPAVIRRGQALVELSEVRRIVGVVSSAWHDVVAVHLPVRDVVLGGRFGSLGVPPHVRGRVTPADEEAADAAILELGIERLARRDRRSSSGRRSRSSTETASIASGESGGRDTGIACG